MEVEEFLKEAAVMKEIKHPNLVQLLGNQAQPQKRGHQGCCEGLCSTCLLSGHHFLIGRSKCLGACGEARQCLSAQPLLPPSCGFLAQACAASAFSH